LVHFEVRAGGTRHRVQVQAEHARPEHVDRDIPEYVAHVHHVRPLQSVRQTARQSVAAHRNLVVHVPQFTGRERRRQFLSHPSPFLAVSEKQTSRYQQHVRVDFEPVVGEMLEVANQYPADQIRVPDHQGRRHRLKKPANFRVRILPVNSVVRVRLLFQSRQQPKHVAEQRHGPPGEGHVQFPPFDDVYEMAQHRNRNGRDYRHRYPIDQPRNHNSQRRAFG